MSPDPPVFILLGRLGDVVNALPILKVYSERFQCPIPLLTHERYASVLEGCSYVWPEIWKGDFWHTLGEATDSAKAKFKNVINLQTGGALHGQPMVFEHKARSFCLEAYVIAGLEAECASLPLEFDKRDPERERKLIESAIGQDTRPPLLCNFTGISSPFPAVPAILEQIEKWRGTLKLVDLGIVKGARFFDLLGLYDIAAGLITIDTATLHLAAASQVPYIAFVQDEKGPWYASIPKGRCLLQFGYSKGAASEVFHNRIARMAARKLVTHLWPRHTPSGDALRRNALAAHTWAQQWWEECPVDETMTSRYVADSETRKLPFVRDMIDWACKGKPDQHVIVFTNADSCVSDYAMAQTFWKLSEPGVDCCYSNRRDFAKLKRPLTGTEVAAGELYPGNDWFGFHVGWWRKHRDTYPDMLVGAEAWDCIMRLLMEETHPGKKIQFDTFVYHEKHFSPVYNDAKARVELPTQRHNRGLAQQFVKQRNIDPKPLGLA